MGKCSGLKTAGRKAMQEGSLALLVPVPGHFF